MNAPSRHAVLTADVPRPLPRGAQPMGSHGALSWVRIGGAQVAGLDGPALAGWKLAYLDEAEYLAGTIGFTPAQAAAVMAKRAGDPPQTLSDLSDALGEYAAALGAWGRSLGGAWERNADRLFRLHQETFFTGRFVLGTHEDIVYLIRLRTGLAALETELAARPDCPPAWAPVFAGLDAKPALAGLAQAAAHLGEPIFTRAPYLDRLPRIAFTSGSPAIQDRMSRYEIDAEPWRDAHLVPLTSREIRDLQVLGAATVYLTTEDYQRSSSRLTPDQRRAEIDGRIAKGIPYRDWFASVRHLRLTCLAVLAGHREEEAASSQADAANLARLDAVFAAEMEALGYLARLEWGDPETAGFRDRAADLRDAAKTLAGFADRAGEAALADLMAVYAKTLAALEPV